MKKRTVTALIVAAALIVAGVGIAAAGFAARGFDRESMSIPNQTENTYVVAEAFDSIHIDTQDCDVTFAMFSGRADTLITCRESDRVSHSVVVEDGVLKVEMMDNRKWYDKIGIFWEDMEMTVYLPESQYQSLRVDTATGDIEVPEQFSFSDVELFSDTGEIDCAAAVAERIVGGTATGDIQIRGGGPGILNLTSDTGDIELYDIGSGGEFRLKTATGSMELENVNCDSLHTESATGEIELERVVVQTYWLALNDTGDVTITDSDAAEVSIETATGDVTGNFLSPKIFWAHSNTGKETVPDSQEGGSCRIESDTGNINVR